MALTQADIKNAKALKRAYRLVDSKGLYLLVECGGERHWKLSYTFAGRDKVISLGEYPQVDLKRARQLRDDARELMADGIDPVSHCIKQELRPAGAVSFEELAQEWLDKVYRFEVSQAQLRRSRQQLEGYLLTVLGKRLVSEVTPEDIKRLGNALGAKGHIDRGRRLVGLGGRIYRYALASGAASARQGAGLKQRVAGARARPEFILGPGDRLYNLAASLCGRVGRGSTTAALSLSVWLLAKPAEVVNARWSDMDLDAGEWRIRRRSGAANGGFYTHVIPLPRQAVALLRELEPITGSYVYVFPGAREKHHHMSVATLRRALRRASDVAPNRAGIRVLAADVLGELGYRAEQVQALLADDIGIDSNDCDNGDKAVGHQQIESLPRSNSPQRIESRRALLQAWADSLDRALRHNG